MDLRGAVILDAAAPVRVVGKCHVCGSEFGEGQEAAWEKHVGRCARAHIDDIRQSAHEQLRKGTLWDEDTWDPEVAAHLREVGKRMLREGRLEVLPHERAGNS